MKLNGRLCLVACLTLIGSCTTSRDPGEPEPERAAVAAAFTERATEDCPFGCPIGHSADSVIVDRDIYTLAYNKRTKFADWVSFSLTKDSIGPTQPRDWQIDDNFLADERINEDDWSGANPEVGYERGHLALLTDFTGRPADEWEQANILSNIAPQCGEFNIGPWGALEDAEKELARSVDQPVLISVGSTYEHAMPKLPSASLESGLPKPHRVPSGFWKIIAIRDGQKVEVAAFDFDQHHLIPDKCKRGPGHSEGRDFCAALVPLEAIEVESSLDLLPVVAASRVEDASKVPTDLLEKLGCPQE